MPESPVLLSVISGHARITLNRPERLNAVTRDLMLDLGATVAAVVADPSVKVISLTGAGRGFCAGQDLSERDPRKLAAPLDLGAIQRELFHPVITALTTTPKPVIACVNGVAAGAGAGLALAADIVIAAESAGFAFSFAKVGLSVDAAVGRALAQALGPARAKALLLLGESLTASEAATAGLIWRAIPDAELAAAHDALAARLLAIPASALGGIKTALNAWNLAPDAYLSLEADQQRIAGAHPNYAEGVLAFLEKRPPVFS
jgi:2-(1,2-epoxy-1,2-dihydrophenyl)acetyl-CoA isomerase